MQSAAQETGFRQLWEAGLRKQWDGGRGQQVTQKFCIKGQVIWMAKRSCELKKTRYPKLRNLMPSCVSGRCKNLESLKSFLPYSSQLSGASILSMCPHPERPQGSPWGAGCSLMAARWRVSLPSWVPSRLIRAPSAVPIVADDSNVLRLPRWQEIFHFLGFPDGSISKESACRAGDSGTIPGSGRSPGEVATHPSILAWRTPWTVQFTG